MWVVYEDLPSMTDIPTRILRFIYTEADEATRVARFLNQKYGDQFVVEEENEDYSFPQET